MVHGQLISFLFFPQPLIPNDFLILTGKLIWPKEWLSHFKHQDIGRYSRRAVKSFSSSPSPLQCGHHYLILREHFIPFPPSDVMNAPQPCQIQVTTFIFTVVSRDRQKKHIYLQRWWWSYQGETGKNWNACCPVVRHQNRGQILKQQQELPSAVQMWPWRQFEAHLHVRHVPVQLQQLLDMWKTTPEFLNLFGDWTKHSPAKPMLQNTSSAAFPQQDCLGWRTQSFSKKNSAFLLCSVDWSVCQHPYFVIKYVLKGSHKTNVGKTQDWPWPASWCSCPEQKKEDIKTSRGG